MRWSTWSFLEKYGILFIAGIGFILIDFEGIKNMKKKTFIT